MLSQARMKNNSFTLKQPMSTCKCTTNASNLPAYREKSPEFRGREP